MGTNTDGSAVGAALGKADAKPIRTLLFVPGSNLDRLANSMNHGADAVMIDLEEPRTPFPEVERDKARAGVRAFLDGDAAAGAPVRWFARVQPPASGQTLKDLRAVMGPHLTGVLLPKVYGPADVYRMDGLLTCTEAEMGLPAGSTAIYPILETADSLRLAYEIAVASPRVRYMGGAVSRFGDIHQAIGYRWSAEGRETLFLRSKVLIDARSAGIRYPISGMWGGDTDDVDGLRRWATELRDLGYFGMMLGASAHVPIVNQIFSPTADEIAYWQELDRLAADAEAGGSGPIVYGAPNQGEGHEVHIAHIGSARQNLNWAVDLGLI
ncbi:MAG TPA: aldolase/citrate lyase family protein [Acidimicrobiales bacterium]|jgi:citrate lyase subunit beta/citryl-CoA lyase|nr:aldolase/citrate lyase family protein [Acidimicrobiales bacterium]